MTRAPKLFLLLSAILIGLGLVMVFNTTSAEILDKGSGENLAVALTKQTVYGAVGALLALIVYRLKIDTLFAWSPTLFFTTLALLALLFLPGVGQTINGARRWISIGGLSFQPSEMMKLLIPLFYIHFFMKKQEALLLKEFLLLLFLLALPIVFVILEPDNGTAFIMLVTLITLFFLTKVRWVYWGLPITLFAICGILFASQMRHVGDRIRIYLNPELDLLGKGHQPFQAKIATGSGGLFGRGFGQSLQKLNYLPEARSDYIAAIFAEEFGYCGVLTLLLLYMTLAYLGFYIAINAPTRRTFYLAALLTFLIAFQAFLNLGVVSGLLPSKGTNLPLFSQGGSSLIANMIAVALILRTAKRGEEKGVAYG
jgi:cell division protein FtsW